MYPRKLAVSVMKTAGSEELAFQKWKWSERKKSFKSSWISGGHLSGLPPIGLGIFTASDLKEAVKKKWQKIVNAFHLRARVHCTRVSPRARRGYNFNPKGILARSPLVWGYAMLMSPSEGETAVHGCHCLGDMAVRRRKIMAIPRRVRQCWNFGMLSTLWVV